MNAVSVVIITLNEERRIGRLLEDLSKQIYQDFEVIVVDSNSDDATCEVAEAYALALPQLTVHKMEKRGVSLGRNVGAELASNERILFLDADVRLDPLFLLKAVNKLEEKKLEVAGVYLGAKGQKAEMKAGYWLMNAGLFITQFLFPTAVGACIFSTRRLHNDIGGFDESISLCEDCDYVNRASNTWKFRMLPMSFQFDSRRLQQDGTLKTGFKYLKANCFRLFRGEIRDNEIEYRFGHYDDQKTSPSSPCQQS